MKVNEVIKFTRKIIEHIKSGKMVVMSKLNKPELYLGINKSGEYIVNNMAYGNLLFVDLLRKDVEQGVVTFNFKED